VLPFLPRRLLLLLLLLLLLDGAGVAEAMAGVGTADVMDGAAPSLSFHVGVTTSGGDPTCGPLVADLGDSASVAGAFMPSVAAASRCVTVRAIST